MLLRQSVSLPAPELACPRRKSGDFSVNVGVLERLRRRWRSSPHGGAVPKGALFATISLQDSP